MIDEFIAFRSLAETHVDLVGIKDIAAAITHNASLEKLLFDISPFHFYFIAILKHFSLGNNKIDDEGIAILALALPLNSSLVEISFASQKWVNCDVTSASSLDGNPTGLKGAQALAKVLPDVVSLKAVEFETDIFHFGAASDCCKLQS